MTHNQLVRAVYNKQVSSVNCMGQRCKGTCNCYECSENLVTEYEDEIRVKTLDEVLKILEFYEHYCGGLLHAINEIEDLKRSIEYEMEE